MLLTCMNLIDKLSGKILLMCNLRGSRAVLGITSAWATKLSS